MKLDMRTVRSPKKQPGLLRLGLCRSGILLRGVVTASQTVLPGKGQEKGSGLVIIILKRTR